MTEPSERKEQYELQSAHWKFARKRDWWRRFTKEGRRNMRAARALSADPVFLRSYAQLIEDTANEGRPRGLITREEADALFNRNDDA